MRFPHWHWVICVALFAAPIHGQEIGDYSGLPKDLAAAATAYDLAQFKADRRELERLLADDYTLADSSGKNQTKAELIADTVQPGNKTTYVAISQQVYKVWPDGAALGGIVDAKGIAHGKAYTMRARFVDVWAKRHGQWQVIFTQVNASP